jgi:hypothetical protein
MRFKRRRKPLSGMGQMNFVSAVRLRVRPMSYSTSFYPASLAAMRAA